MVNFFKSKGVRVLNYVNPFFSDPSNYTNFVNNNYYKEGNENGFFVKDRFNESYAMKSLTIEFYTLDLTNPKAVSWMKNIIKEQVIVGAESSGFMCDFGEYLPFDAVLYSGENANHAHNKYPEDWIRLVSEAINELNVQDEVVFILSFSYIIIHYHHLL